MQGVRVSEERRRQLNVRIDRDLHVRLKVVAALTGRGMAEMAEDFLRDRLSQEECALGLDRKRRKGEGE